MASTNFEITDAYGLLDEVGELEQSRQNICRLKEEIENCQRRIVSAWASDTEDKESYLGGITKTMEKLGILCASIGKLSATLTTFAQDAIRQGNNG